MSLFPACELIPELLEERCGLGRVAVARGGAHRVGRGSERLGPGVAPRARITSQTGAQRIRSERIVYFPPIPPSSEEYAWSNSTRRPAPG